MKTIGVVIGKYIKFTNMNNNNKWNSATIKVYLHSKPGYSITRLTFDKDKRFCNFNRLRKNRPENSRLLHPLAVFRGFVFLFIF